MKHGSVTSTAAQNDIKLKICCAMNQLNDLDSRSVGVAILQSLIEKSPDKLLHLIVEPFYTINPNLSALCRKELCLLMGCLGSKRANTALFHSKYLFKLISNLSKRSADSDSRVRDACGQSVAQITKRCVDSSTDPTRRQLIDKILKPILKQIEKCPSPHSITGNFICLSNVVLSASHHLRESHLDAICKCITSGIHHKRHCRSHIAMLLCIDKLIYIAHRSFINSAHFPPLLAILIDALSNNDWNVRHQAVTAIHSLGVCHRHQNPTVPQIEKHRDEITAHLERLKYDKVSNVRNVASETLTLWIDTECIDNEERPAEDTLNALNRADGLNAVTTTVDANIAADEVFGDKLESIPLETPWFDRHEKKDRDDGSAANQQHESDGSDHGVRDSAGGDGHSLMLQQQQLMLKTIQNLESYIRREVGGLKTRIHSVERDLQRIKVSQQNKEWMHENHRQNEARHCRQRETECAAKASVPTMKPTTRVELKSDKSNPIQSKNFQILQISNLSNPQFVKSNPIKSSNLESDPEPDASTNDQGTDAIDHQEPGSIANDQGANSITHDEANDKGAHSIAYGGSYLSTDLPAHSGK